MDVVDAPGNYAHLRTAGRDASCGKIPAKKHHA
jgi:hypothetical protein